MPDAEPVQGAPQAGPQQPAQPGPPGAAAPKPTNWPRALAIAGVLVIVASGAAYLLAGRTAWTVVSWVGGFAVIGHFLSTRDWAAKDQRPALDRYFPVATGIVLLGAWIAIGMKFPLSPVHVDNYTGTAVALELNGKPWLKLPADSSRQVFLRDGAYQVTVRAEPGGGVLGSHDAAVAGRSTYVLNVLGRMSYREGTREYRKVPLPPMLAHNPPETTIEQVWFNTDADFIFEEPPESISVSGSGDVATRSYLRRAGKAKPPALPNAASSDKPVAPVFDAERHAFLERNVGRFKPGDDMNGVRRELRLDKLTPRPRENQPPDTARDDYFFEGFVLIVEHGPRMNAEGGREAGTDVLRELLLVRDGLSSAQRREAYAKSWSEFVRARSAPAPGSVRPDAAGE